MTLISVIILAIIQGLTEFLPVSSSGHLALAGTIMSIPKEEISFEIVLHLGTLLAVIGVYRRDLLKLVSGVLKGRRESLVLAGLLALGSVPAAAAGFFFADAIAMLFAEPLVVSIMLIVTGCALFSTRFAPEGIRDHPSWKGSLMVGVSQALALLPGISRSGFTISTGLFAGIRREEAARFSFLLSIPAITGAAVLKLPDAGIGIVDLPFMAVGLAVSAITGYLALKVLLKFLTRGKFSMFAWYCWILGLAGMTISIAGV